MRSPVVAVLCLSLSLARAMPGARSLHGNGSRGDQWKEPKGPAKDLSTAKFENYKLDLAKLDLAKEAKDTKDETYKLNALKYKEDAEMYRKDAEKYKDDVEKYKEDAEMYMKDAEKYKEDAHKYKNDVSGYKDDAMLFSGDSSDPKEPEYVDPAQIETTAKPIGDVLDI